MLEMSKKENVAGRLGWQGNAQAHRKRFSDLQPREVITILAILFGKSRSRLSKKSVVTFKADSAQSKRTTFLPKRELAQNSKSLRHVQKSSTYFDQSVL